MMTCRFCGACDTQGIAFDKWVKPTFTDWDKLLPGDGICQACLFWFDEKSVRLQDVFGKDGPQKMRNYSHFVSDGVWTPLSKAHKAQMRTLLLTPPFPELAAIADSGQKHIVFRARRNTPGSVAGWVQFEEQSIWVQPDALRVLADSMDALLRVFSKAEIESGRYQGYRIIKFGADSWLGIETYLRPQRGTPLFALALFLAQKPDEETDNGRIEAAGGDTADGDLAGHPGRLQESLSDVDLGAVRERDTQRGVHQQPGQVRQLNLF